MVVYILLENIDFILYKKIIQVESTMTEMIGVHDPTRVYEFNQQVYIDLNVT